MEPRLPYGAQIRLLNEAFKRNANNTIQSMGLTVQQSHMLKALTLMDGCCSLKDMERAFGMAQSTIAGMASRLEKKGFIESYTDPADRRVKRIRLTPSGWEVEAAVHDNLLAAEKEALSVLSAEEQAELSRLLDALIHKVIDADDREGFCSPWCRRKEENDE